MACARINPTIFLVISEAREADDEKKKGEKEKKRREPRVRERSQEGRRRYVDEGKGEYINRF